MKRTRQVVVADPPPDDVQTIVAELRGLHRELCTAINFNAGDDVLGREELKLQLMRNVKTLAETDMFFLLYHLADLMISYHDLQHHARGAKP